MITVLGAGGFIGSHLVKYLQEQQFEFFAPARGGSLQGINLGDVIYCIGLTADFRQKPFETVEAHVCYLSEVLKNGNFDSLTYLSSTRLYISCNGENVNEDSRVSININDPDELYTLTKLTGERLCLSSGKKARVARLSNVYGSAEASDNFISYLLRKIDEDGAFHLSSSLSSAKDYIDISDVCRLLVDIATRGQQAIYNVASGENVSNEELIGLLKQVKQFDYTVDAAARETIFPRINVSRINSEFGFETGLSKTKLFEFIQKLRNDNNR